jgi:predicted transcriptional regulator
MTRKEFQESVEFSLVLNEWAAGQPGYKSPVTKADVEEVMAKIRPLLKPGQKLSVQDKLKYQFLVQVIKKKSPKPLMSMEVSVVQMKDQSDFINVLLNEKLVEKINDQFELTELGRRFIRNFEQVERE